jgi:hypothetical protein
VGTIAALGKGAVVESQPQSKNTVASLLRRRLDGYWESVQNKSSANSTFMSNDVLFGGVVPAAIVFLAVLLLAMLIRKKRTT